MPPEQAGGSRARGWRIGLQGWQRGRLGRAMAATAATGFVIRLLGLAVNVIAEEQEGIELQNARGRLSAPM